jgi:hypothetical protein
MPFTTILYTMQIYRQLLSGTNVTSTSIVRPTAMLALFTAKRICYKAPHYEISSSLLLFFPHIGIQMF